MAVSYDYAGLTAQILNQVHDDGDELVATTDDIIARGETRLLRDLDLEIFDVTDTGSFSSGSQLVTKPSGYLAGRSLSYVSSGTTRVFMEQRTYDYLLDYWPTSGSTTSTPKYYAELNETQWYVAGTPASAFVWTARFMKRPTGLSSGTTTTWLGTNAGDLLLLACLISAEEFLEADERAPMWTTEYVNLLQAAKHELRRLSRSDYAPVAAAPTPKQEK